MPSRLESFVRKRGQILTYVGALIVFFTFIVKEGLGEHWKHLAEAIDGTASTYGIRRETAGLRTQLIVVQETLEATHERRPFIGDLWTNSVTERDRASVVLIEQIKSVAGKIATIRLLVDFLPEENADRKDSLLLANEVDKFQKEVEIDYARTSNSHSDAPFEPQLGSWEIRASELDMKSNGLADTVLKDASLIRNRNDEYSRISWWISSSLFALGWGFGLLGKLYGVPEVAGEE